LLATLVWRVKVWPNAQQALAAVGLSFLGFSGYYLLLVFSVRDAGVAVPSLIIGTIPIWMMLLGRPAGLRMSGLLPGLALTTLGLALMTQASLSMASLDARADLPHFWRGVAVSLVAMLLWTAFGLLNAAWLKKNSTISAAVWANWLGVATGLVAWLIWLALGTNLKALLAQEGLAQAAIVCLATGVGSAWLATILWNIASQRLSASLCGQLIVSETIFALVYAFSLDGHWPTFLQAIACVLFAVGILASIKAHR
jgi:drug/metabolite transporter (DMT)-like permease